MVVSGHAGTVLIVDDDADYAQTVVAPHFKGSWNVLHAESVPESMVLLQHATDLRVAIIDLNIPGGTDESHPSRAGFEVVKAIRDRFPSARVVALTGHLAPVLVNSAQSLGAEYLVKGSCQSNLAQLATDLRDDSQQASVIDVAASDIASSFGLTGRQTEILVLLSRSLSREETANQLGISEWTLKSHIRNILRRCQTDRLENLLRQIRKRALR